LLLLKRVIGNESEDNDEEADGQDWKDGIQAAFGVFVGWA
jgi:hypothetical protein